MRERENGEKSRLADCSSGRARGCLYFLKGGKRGNLLFRGGEVGVKQKKREVNFAGRGIIEKGEVWVRAYSFQRGGKTGFTQGRQEVKPKDSRKKIEG